MKRILIFLMVLILTVGAAGCGSAKHTVSGNTNAGQTAKEETSSPGTVANTKYPEAESAGTEVTTEKNETTAPANASSEFQIYGTRADGLPENYPDQVVPIYQLKEILNSEGNSWGFGFEYVTSASYDDAAAYYRELLQDEEDFEEEELSDETFHCRTSDWDININIRNVFGAVKVMIELYSLAWEDNPYLE